MVEKLRPIETELAGALSADLLNAVAATTSGGAYVTLAQLAGVAGLGWVLFRTAFGGSWKDNAKWMLRSWRSSG